MKAINKAKLLYRTIRRKGFVYKNHDIPKKLGEKILLLGNGPSAGLYNDKKDLFTEYDLLVVNLFPVKNPDFWSLKPRYIALLDPRYVDPVAYINSDAKEEGYAEDCLALVETMEKIDWPVTIISYANRVFPYKNQNISYIRLSDARINWNETKGCQKYFFHNWAIPNAQGVMILSLYFAEIFGYKEIGLLGVEQSYLNTLCVDIYNRLYRKTKYFYTDVIKYSQYTYEEELADSLEMFRGFRFAAEMAKYRGIVIKNYTVNSYLQCFEKDPLVMGDC